MTREEITDKRALEALAKMEDDAKEVFLLSGGDVRLTAVSATRVVNQMRANHGTGLLETYVLGQAYVAGLLLSSTVKGDDRVQLSVECGGPIKGISVEAWACGAVRGYLLENPIPLAKPLESLDTSLLYGPGFLTVSKILEGSKEPVSGTVMLQYGNLANDLALYFHESEQTPTLFALSLHFEGGSVTGAGGLFIQAMPGCPEETLSKLADLANKLPSPGTAISEGVTPRDYVADNFRDFAPERLAHSFVGFSCPCDRRNFEGYLSSLPEKELDEILKGDFPLTLECFNCGSRYSFTEDEVRAFSGKKEEKR